jgi:hypothetical protein
MPGSGHWFPYEITRCPTLQAKHGEHALAVWQLQMRPAFPALQPPPALTAGLDGTALESRTWA